MAILAGDRTAWYYDPKSKKSLADVANATRGVGPSFSFIRIMLALLIFLAHTIYVNSDQLTAVVTSVRVDSVSWFDSVWQFILNTKSRVYVSFVPMFFVLSGFLVAGSAARAKSIPTFFYFRFLRIFPALCVEVALAAIILGAVFTTLPLSQYFSDWQFYRYFGNILGFVTFELPGVFISNPLSGIVNANLWTLPAEFYCYFIMGLLLFLNVMKPGHWFGILLAIALVAMAALNLFWGIFVTPSVYSTPVVTAYFLAGVATYKYADKIPMNPLLFVVACIVLAILMPYPEAAVVLVPAITYITIFFGFLPHFGFKALDKSDYSYGMYLYGFPIMQSFIALFPDASRLTIAVTSLATTVVFAALSWHYIEKPFLALKKFAK
jgi:peptidoglycan/LPS O-acetylase OafA/YrhL